MLIRLSTNDVYSQQQPGELPLPNLQKQGTATQLVVDGKPFLMLPGELSNSSASDLKYMESIWPKLVNMNLNTVLVPVYWEQIEPAEGSFDFNLIDGIIKEARRYNMKLVLLWFGTWKNSMSCYTPSWIKTNQARFQRAESSIGKSLDILSPFSVDNMTADAKAFSALMKHIKLVDSKNRTILMVQVENEIGMIPEPRDYSVASDKAYNSTVPAGMTNYLSKNMDKLVPELLSHWEKKNFKTTGTWEEVFGKGIETEELFMAWYFARYTNYVAGVGKNEYTVPMFLNAALITDEADPGEYPSGGPLPHLMDIWQIAAPQIDFMSPDFYNPDIPYWCKLYSRNNNAMFIPEAKNTYSMVNAFYAIGQHNAMGYSPFAIESVSDEKAKEIANANEILNQLSPLILSKQGNNEIKAAVVDSAPNIESVTLGNYTFKIKHEYSWPYAVKQKGETPRFGCMIIMLTPEEFLVVGKGVVLTFEDNIMKTMKVGILSVEEGKYESGKWVPGRKLNGDDTHQGRHIHIDGNSFGMRKIKLYSYK